MTMIDQPKHRRRRLTSITLVVACGLFSIAAGCVNSRAQGIVSQVEMPLGRPADVCAGSRRQIRAESEQTLSRVLDPESGSCTLRLRWSGPLLLNGELRRVLIRRDGSPVERLDLVVDTLELRDEMGAPLAGATFEQLKLAIRVDKRKLGSVERTRGSLPLDLGLRAPFRAAALAQLLQAVRRGEALRATVVLEIARGDAQRKALARSIRGMRLALHVRAEIVNESK
jgi:hypothetical protein